MLLSTTGSRRNFPSPMRAESTQRGSSVFCPGSIAMLLGSPQDSEGQDVLRWPGT